ncbi:hypothetical protein [Thermogemmatispora carboxidivorans]|uniref:hypothetical protein n=1 Tax=Thermogemmatispora carboxidivorans TaxID=1382306 RepID=UPI0012DF66DC|nr:hypothetical protein [Thermogemmatispora carboxidivorans]
MLSAETASSLPIASNVLPTDLTGRSAASGQGEFGTAERHHPEQGDQIRGAPLAL